MSPFVELKIVPDVIPEVPENILSMSYGDIEVTPGLNLTPTQVKETPELSWDAEDDALYTVVNVDVDIPAALGFKSFTHWLAVNVPGNDISAGNTLFEYLGSGAPEGTGLHRYVFLVYKQPGLLDESVTDSVKDEKLADRGTFSLDSFVENNGLIGPVAANCYQAEFDDYVPTFMANLMKKYGALA